MRASDIMTDHVQTIEPDAKLEQLVRLMLKYRISGLPVVNRAGNMVGIVTETDLLRRSELGTKPHRSYWLNLFTPAGRLADEYVKTSGRRVDEVMTKNVVFASPETPVSEVVAAMERHSVRRLPILRDGTVVGIITRHNIVRALSAELVEETCATSDDRAIAKDIRKQMNEANWGPLPYVYISVEDGVVKLTGVVTDERMQAAARVLAENTPGVRKVVDEIRSIEPADFGY